MNTNAQNNYIGCFCFEDRFTSKANIIISNLTHKAADGVWLLVPVISCLLISGCAIKHDSYAVPTAPLPAQFKHTEALAKLVKSKFTADDKEHSELPIGELLNEWWRFFENDELNHLVDQAMANNADLRIAMLRISQSQSRAEQAFAGQFPEISAVGQLRHDNPSNGINSFTQGGSQKERQNAQIGPRADWRVDIWGELKALTEAAEMEAWAATYQRDDTRRLLIANVISQYIEYLSLSDRLHVAHETKAALDNLLQAVNERLKVGDATIIESEQQRAAVLAVEATIPGLELQRETATNALAQLLGVTPGLLSLSDKGMDSLKFPNITPVVPSTLLLRRPDVRAVEAQLLAADADIDVARARVLPPLDLTAQAGWGIFSLAGMVSPYGPLVNLAANLSATIFDYGKRLEGVALARARHEELVEAYIRVIYAAVRETEDALVNTHMNGKRLDTQKAATDAASQAWKYSQDSYDFGDIDFLTLLDTERTYHRNLDEFHRVRMERFRGLVGLFAALGGGVPQGDVLPGDGQRPEGAKPSNISTASLQAPGVIWDETADDQAFWMVQLAGLQDVSGVGHVWRDMQQRFSALMLNRVLMPREEGRIENNGQERIRWYRLFIARFADENEAQTFCRALGAQLVRCTVVSSESSAFRNLQAGEPVEVAGSEPVKSGSFIASGVRIQAHSTEIQSESRAPAGHEGAENNTQSSTGSDNGRERVIPAQTVNDSFQEAYAVQLSTLFKQLDAENELPGWQHKGIKAYVYPIAGADGKTLFTVRTGMYKDRKEANNSVASLRNNLQVDAIPVSIRIDKTGQPTPLIPYTP